MENLRCKNLVSLALISIVSLTAAGSLRMEIGGRVIVKHKVHLGN